jgi:Photosynthetic reaction centre cytochrome C subunit
MNSFPVILLVLSSLTPNFSGVWEFKPIRLKIEHKGQSITVTMRTATEQNTQTYIIGQESKNELHGGAMTSRAVWEGDTLVVRSVVLYGKQELHLVDRWTLSPDGNKLTYREKHQFAAEPEAEETRFLARLQDDAWQQDAPPKPAEEVYKNIQVFKGVPAPRIVPVMNMLNRWLGVTCDHCHVGSEYDKEDKAAKQTARKMFLMVRKIGQDNFGANNPVTCWTCHRGQVKPESLPLQ